VEGKPPGLARPSVEVLALLPAPDRSGQPVARNCFGPHPACPSLNRLQRYAPVQTCCRLSSMSPRLNKCRWRRLPLKQRSTDGSKRCISDTNSIKNLWRNLEGLFSACEASCFAHTLYRGAEGKFVIRSGHCICQDSGLRGDPFCRAPHDSFIVEGLLKTLEMPY